MSAARYTAERSNPKRESSSCAAFCPWGHGLVAPGPRPAILDGPANDLRTLLERIERSHVTAAKEPPAWLTSVGDRVRGMQTTRKEKVDLDSISEPGGFRVGRILPKLFVEAAHRLCPEHAEKPRDLAMRMRGLEPPRGLPHTDLN